MKNVMTTSAIFLEFWQKSSSDLTSFPKIYQIWQFIFSTVNKSPVRELDYQFNNDV